MIALALFAVAQLSAAAESEEIVVIGRRLQSVQVHVSRDASGRLGCGLSHSTGNAGLDGDLCRTAAKCVGKGAVTKPDVEKCIADRKPGLLEKLRRTSWRRRG